MTSHITKGASNALSRLMFYAKNPFNFGSQDRWSQKDVLQATASLFYLIQDIEKVILTRSSTSIPDSIFKSKLFINNFINDLCKPLIKMYESENSHLIKIVKELEVKITDIEKDLKGKSMVPELADFVLNSYSLINKFKELVKTYRLPEAINTYDELAKLQENPGIEVFANPVGTWLRKTYLKISRDSDTPVRLAAGEAAGDIRKDINDIMDAIQNDSQTMVLAGLIATVIKDIIEFIPLLDQLADVHNNFINIQKNEGNKSKNMLVPSRDLAYLKNMKNELAKSLIQFEGISRA